MITFGLLPFVSEQNEHSPTSARMQSESCASPAAPGAPAPPADGDGAPPTALGDPPAKFPTPPEFVELPALLMGPSPEAEEPPLSTPPAGAPAELSPAARAPAYCDGALRPSELLLAAMPPHAQRPVSPMKTCSAYNLFAIRPPIFHNASEVHRAL